MYMLLNVVIVITTIRIVIRYSDRHRNVYILVYTYIEYLYMYIYIYIYIYIYMSILAHHDRMNLRFRPQLFVYPFACLLICVADLFSCLPLCTPHVSLCL